jgi:TPR repeat protein
VGSADIEEALKLYRMAALGGNPHAQFRLGEMHAKGDGVEKDDVQACMWCELANEFNYMSGGTDHVLEDQIEEFLFDLKERMTDSQVEEAKALVEKSFKSLPSSAR